MSGITGIIDFNKQSSKEILENMTSTLNHLGPDGSETELISENNSQLGLGHRRLSIIDLSENAKQPMQFNQFSITFNSEIYNYKENKLELENISVMFGHETIKGGTLRKSCEEESKNLTNLLKQ